MAKEDSFRLDLVRKFLLPVDVLGKSRLHIFYALSELGDAGLNLLLPPSQVNLRSFLFEDLTSHLGVALLRLFLFLKIRLQVLLAVFDFLIQKCENGVADLLNCFSRVLGHVDRVIVYALHVFLHDFDFFSQPIELRVRGLTLIGQFLFERVINLIGILKIALCSRDEDL